MSPELALRCGELRASDRVALLSRTRWHANNAAAVSIWTLPAELACQQVRHRLLLCWSSPKLGK